MREQSDLLVGPKLIECHCLFGLFVAGAEAAHRCGARDSRLPLGQWATQPLASRAREPPAPPTWDGPPSHPRPSHLPAAPAPGTTGHCGVSLQVGLVLQLHLSPFAPLHFPPLPCFCPLQRLLRVRGLPIPPTSALPWTFLFLLLLSLPTAPWHQGYSLFPSPSFPLLLGRHLPWQSLC